MICMKHLEKYLAHSKYRHLFILIVVQSFQSIQLGCHRIKNSVFVLCFCGFIKYLMTSPIYSIGSRNV